MNVSIESYGHAVLVNLKGELTEDTLGALQQTLERELAERPVADVMLNMEEVPFVDSAALEFLLDFQDESAARSGQVRLLKCDENVRKILEMTRLATRLGARLETLFGLAGVGDLVATCSSRLSRNRHVGEELGRGRPLQRILDDMVMVAEGVPTTRAVHGLAGQLGIDMPITARVHAVLFEQQDPREIVGELMSRQPKSEVG